MDKAAKAEARIKEICNRLGITEGGRRWLDTALDPFKDILQKPEGYPDRVMAPSVVQTVHSSISVTKPSGVAGNWDCNIFLDSLWKSVDLKETVRFDSNGFQFGNSANPSYKRGGLIVRGAAAGTTLGMTTQYNNISYVTDVFDDETSSRIIAIGLEVHNTTAELNKQGSVITYMVSDEPEDFVIFPYASGLARSVYPKPGTELVEPPITAGEAIDLPNSLQWAAAKGCYVVPRFVSEENKPQDLNARVAVALDDATGNTYTETISATATDVFFDANPRNSRVPISLSGAYFTGLSPETELTVNLTYYIEQFPSVSSTLRRLAGPGCCEDFAALELYTKIVKHMPSGVEVNDNFLGAFVAGIARVASMVMPYIPRVINAISAGSQVVSTLSSAVNRDRALISGNGNGNSQPSTNASNSRALVPFRETKDVDIRMDQNSRVKEIKIHQSDNQKQQAHRITNTRSQRVKNSRDKDFNRLDKYIKAGNAGNKYIM